eukprot:superscaffoldBa00004251_g18538
MLLCCGSITFGGKTLFHPVGLCSTTGLLCWRSRDGAVPADCLPPLALIGRRPGVGSARRPGDALPGWLLWNHLSLLHRNSSPCSDDLLIIGDSIIRDGETSTNLVLSWSYCE